VLQKRRFNIIAFGTDVVKWQEAAVECTPAALREACTWIDGLQSCGTTNSLGALQQAFADTTVDAIYFLSDGRPDQGEAEIIASVQAMNEQREVGLRSMPVRRWGLTLTRCTHLLSPSKPHPIGPFVTLASAPTTLLKPRCLFPSIA